MQPNTSFKKKKKFLLYYSFHSPNGSSYMLAMMPEHDYASLTLMSLQDPLLLVLSSLSLNFWGKNGMNSS